MNFNETAKPIYLQIAERICDDIANGKYVPDGRIPSVREFAAQVLVNANTVMRTYEHLTQRGIIYNKRGIGYFISPDAIEQINKLRHETFYQEELPYFFSRLQRIEIDPDTLKQLYQEYLNIQQ